MVMVVVVVVAAAEAAAAAVAGVCVGFRVDYSRRITRTRGPRSETDGYPTRCPPMPLYGCIYLSARALLGANGDGSKTGTTGIRTQHQFPRFS